MEPYTLHLGDCLEVLKTLPANSIQTCITSPPYFGLRDYGTGTWVGGDPNCDHVSHEIRTGQGIAEFSKKYRGGGHKAGSDEKVIRFREACGKCGARRTDRQIGLEPTPEEFVQAMVAVFREVHRVLRDDGTLWLNLGDSYCTRPNGPIGDKSGINGKEPHVQYRGAHARRSTQVPPGLKHKDLIGMPWRVAFALQDAGWYLRQDIIWHKPNPMPESVRDRCTKSHEYIFLLSKSPQYYYNHEAIKEPATGNAHPRGRGVNPKARANGFKTKQNSSFSAAVTGTVERRNRRSVWTVATRPYKGAHFATFPPDLIEPCILAGSRPNDMVLDPFNGSGTTGAVALQHGRRYVGIDLNPEYIELAEARIEAALAEPAQHELFGVAAE